MAANDENSTHEKAPKPQSRLKTAAVRVAKPFAVRQTKNVKNSAFLVKQYLKFGVLRLRQMGILPTFRDSSHFFYKFGMVIVFLSLISSFSTYFILTDLTPIRPTDGIVSLLLLVSIVLVAIMSLLVIWQVTDLWRARRSRQAGARLHVRIVTLFSLIATVPAVLLAVFASIHLDGRLDKLFSNRTQDIIRKSLNVSHSYLNEHGLGIRNDALIMAKELDKASRLAQKKPKQFQKLLEFQSNTQGISQAYLIDEKGKVLWSAVNHLNQPYFPPVSKAFEVARRGLAVRLRILKHSKVAALKKLENFKNTYLYVLRSISPAVIAHMKQARANMQEYRALRKSRTGVQVAFGLMYVTIALSLLLSAVWLGLWFANRLVEPIRKLIGASLQVSAGDLDVSVKVKDRHGDVALLANTFNTMTARLKSQRSELVETNNVLEERRRFIEAVLYGVTAGVVGVENDGIITLANRSARTLLNLGEGQARGQDLAVMVPEFAGLLAEAQANPRGYAEGQVNMILGTAERNFAVRVTQESNDGEIDGYVLTFDDITELVTAQRTSAWADVARRIAHEIKNPLTPIQLSAERIRRKYGKVITEDREVFDKCTETIIRQVGDIGRMVDEFSSFARMPKPVMELQDIRDVVREAAQLFEMSHPHISFDMVLPDAPLRTLCDRSLITRAITNLVKNASEAIEAAAEKSVDGENYKGRIIVRVYSDVEDIRIEVIDNGVGLPKANRNRLVEPYMTTREKGTGLGLAIVKKITEQHQGQVFLQDASAAECEKQGLEITPKIERGACLRLVMPVRLPAGNADEKSAAFQRTSGALARPPVTDHEAELAAAELLDRD